MIIGIDIGNTHIVTGIYDDNGKLISTFRLATNDKSKKCSANIIKTDKGFKFTKPEINAKECANILIDYGCGEGTDPYWDGEFIKDEKKWFLEI